MSKLDRLIYTERRGGIGMMPDGKSQPDTGYGIYSMSSGLLPGGDFKDREYFERSINLRNASNVSKKVLINSFAYYTPGKGIPMLGYCYQRDGGQSNDRLANAYVDEWLMGEMDFYPMDLFNSSFWSAYQQPFTWYTKDAPKPTQPLEQVDSTALDLVSLREKALNFARKGREDMIRKAVWMLLHQMSLPVAERKFIIIRDTEENVRLWIAAILYQLPQQAAAKVSFNTNGTNLTNPQSNICIINKTTGMALPKGAPANPQQNPALERTFMAMLVGADPRDNASNIASAPAPAQAQANRPWLLLDGVSMKCFDVEPAELQRAYYRSMFADDEVICNFFMDMNEMQDINPTPELCDLFDAQLVLQDQSQWQYEKLVRAIKVMSPHFCNKGHAVLLNYLLMNLCTPNGYGKIFAAEDADNRLVLMRALIRCAEVAGNRDAVAALENAALGHLEKLALDSAAFARLTQYQEDLEIVRKGLSGELISRLFADGLRRFESIDMSRASDQYIRTLYELIDLYIARERTTWSRMWNDVTCKGTLDKMAARVCESSLLTETVMRLFRGDKDLIDKLILISCTSGSGKTDRYRWLCKLLAKGVSLEHTCQLLDKEPNGAAAIESLLCARMEETGCTEEIQSAYNRYLSLKSNVGGQYYAAWLKTLSGMRQNAQYFATIKDMLDSAAGRSSDHGQLIKLLDSLDGVITFEQTEANRKLVSMILDQAETVRHEVKNAELWDFLDNVLDVKSRSMSMYKRCISENPECFRFVVPDGFSESSMCAKFLDAADRESSDPAMQAIVVLIFQFRSTAERKAYYDAWAELICEGSIKHKDDSLSVLVGLNSAQRNGLRTNKECERVLEAMKENVLSTCFGEIMRSVEARLGTMRTDNVADKIIADTKRAFGDKAAKDLNDIFARAQEAYGSTHKGLFGDFSSRVSDIGSKVSDIGSKFSGLFGKKKKGE